MSDQQQGLSKRRQVRFWLIGGIFVVAALYLVRAILLPFVAGFAVAYFLDPLVDKLEEHGLPRTPATALVTGVFFSVLVIVIVMLFPVLQAQVLGFVHNLPAYLERLREFLWPLVEEGRNALSLAGIRIPDSGQMREAVMGISGDAVAWGGNVLKRFWSGGVALFNVVSLLFITPIVAFYILRDWDNLVARIDDLFPRDNVEDFRQQAHLVDQALAGFVRGQATVALTLGVIYAIGWSVAGLEFGLVLGLGTGVLAFIPYVGAAIGFSVAFLVAFAQFGADFTPLAMVAGTFVVAQTLDASFLTPKLVGGRVGLHPVWVVFALLAGGAMFGFVGVLVAVPTAAAIGVLVRFGSARYQTSPYYYGYSARGHSAHGHSADGGESTD